MDIKELLNLTVKNKASDLHLLVGITPTLRIDGQLRSLATFPVLTQQLIEQLIFALVNPEQKELLLANKELDFSYDHVDPATKQHGRFRVNAYFQKGYLSAALRYLPPIIKSVEELRLPKIVHTFAEMRQGFVLVTGPTGHGKSSTLAAIVNEINRTKSHHILTIEDPIEYIYPKGSSIISQRELSLDTHSWAMALRSALREDPDVVLIGEMRDPETMQAAITIAETGHLVFSTLHTNSAAQSIDRIVDSFQEHEREQVRAQLAATLKGIVSIRLVPQIGGGRVPAVEVLIGTPAVSSNIRDGKTHLIDSVIQTSKDVGMIPLEVSLSELVRAGSITLDDAKLYANHEDELLRLTQ
jgi:twitching motility protein PilT